MNNESIITSRKNERVVRTADILRGKIKDEGGLFAVEGVRQCKDALAAGVLRELFITEKCLGKNLCFDLGDIPVNIVMEHVYERITLLKSPEGVCGLCTLPIAPTLKSSGRYAVLCDIQNPENVGAILRSAAAFGFDAAVMVGNCADVTGAKTVRAAAGAVFVLPTMRMSSDEFFTITKTENLRTIAMTSAGDITLDDCAAQDGTAVLIGNEGAGLTSDVISQCDSTVRIELCDFESLNAAVAAGIVLHKFRR